MGAAGTRGAMDIVEIPSHFMEHFIYDARTLCLFMKGPEASKNAAAVAHHVKQEQHLFGALDMELQVAQPLVKLPPVLLVLVKIMCYPRL